MTKLNLEELEALCVDGGNAHEWSNEKQVRHLCKIANYTPQLIDAIEERDKTIAMLRKALGEKAVETLYEGKYDE